MNVLLSIILVLSISMGFMYTGKKLKIPNVVMLILCGILLGTNTIKKLIIEPNQGMYFFLGNVGLVTLMFLAGSRSSLRQFKKEKTDSLIIAIFGTFIPFFFGFLVFKLIGFSGIASFIIGLCMSITSEASKARDLMELKKLKTKVGAALMEAGMIDELFAIIMFIVITMAFEIVQLKEIAVLVFAVIAYILGLVIHEKLPSKIKTILLWTIVPFFFVSIGIHFNISNLDINYYILTLTIFVAIATKLGASLLAKPFVSFNLKQLTLIGWGLNARGGVGISIALYALQNNIINTDVFSSLVIMAIFTTVIFPFVLSKMILENPGIMGDSKIKAFIKKILR